MNQKVSGQTIANCFRHCGAVEVAEELLADPFAELDEVEGSEQDNESREAEEGMDEHEAPATDEPTLNDLVFQLNPTMTAEEYLSADYDLNTCYTFDSTQPEWQEELKALVCEAPLAKKSATTESDTPLTRERGSSDFSRFSWHWEIGLGGSNQIARFLVLRNCHVQNHMRWPSRGVGHTIKNRWLRCTCVGCNSPAHVYFCEKHDSHMIGNVPNAKIIVKSPDPLSLIRGRIKEFIPSRLRDTAAEFFH